MSRMIWTTCKFMHRSTSWLYFGHNDPAMYRWMSSTRTYQEVFESCASCRYPARFDNGDVSKSCLSMMYCLNLLRLLPNSATTISTKGLGRTEPTYLKFPDRMLRSFQYHSNSWPGTIIYVGTIHVMRATESYETWLKWLVMYVRVNSFTCLPLFEGGSSIITGRNA